MNTFAIPEQELNNIVELLNNNCKNKIKHMPEACFPNEWYEWEPDDINIDIVKCRTYCYVNSKYACEQYYDLCASCKNILDEYIVNRSMNIITKLEKQNKDLIEQNKRFK
jgi:hypothetical protein